MKQFFVLTAETFSKAESFKKCRLSDASRAPLKYIQKRVCFVTIILPYRLPKPNQKI